MSTATAKRGAFRVVTTPELKALANHAEVAGFNRTIDHKTLRELSPSGRHVLERILHEGAIVRVKATLSRKEQPSPVEAYLDVKASNFEHLTPFSDQGTR